MCIILKWISLVNVILLFKFLRSGISFARTQRIFDDVEEEWNDEPCRSYRFIIAIAVAVFGEMFCFG